MATRGLGLILRDRARRDADECRRAFVGEVKPEPEHPAPWSVTKRPRWPQVRDYFPVYVVTDARGKCVAEFEHARTADEVCRMWNEAHGG